MGTNFYISTSNKEVKNKYLADDNYKLTDEPTWGYELHIAKTSYGWLPLFQKHKCIQSVKDIKNLYDTGHFFIYDENLKEYTWEEFEKRVLTHNGGVAGAIPKTYHDVDRTSPFYDSNMPDFTPVSHFEYGNGKYAYMYSKDAEGYEFMEGDFS